MPLPHPSKTLLRALTTTARVLTTTARVLTTTARALATTALVQTTTALALTTTALTLSLTAHAADIAVLSAGAIEPGLKAAIRAFEKEAPHVIKVTFNTAPQLRKRIDAGEAWDVVIAPPGAIADFAKANRVGEERANVGRVGLGVAVRPDAPVPDIATSAAIRQTVLNAESIVFNRASTGLYFEDLLKKMGVWGEVEGKTVRYPDGASVMEHLLRGKGREVGFGPITEILLVRDRGLKLVGPLPADIQNFTSYVAAPLANAAQGDAAKTFVRWLASPAAKALFVAAGVE